MAYEYEEYIKNVIGTEAVFSHEKEKRQERVKELQEVYRKAKAWNNYVDSVRSLVSKHADEDTDIEKEARDILSVYMEDE